MKLKSDSVPPVRPPPARHRNSGGESASEVFGFTVDENQFAVLQSEQSAASQREVGLVDPRMTRHLRWAARRAAVQTEGQEPKTKQAETTTVSSFSTIQGNSGTCVNLGVVNCSQLCEKSFPAYSTDILHLQSVESVPYSLGSGVVKNGGGNSLYSDFNVTDVRISCAGPERSAGRPGHTPTRRRLACEKLIEDNCAG